MEGNFRVGEWLIEPTLNSISANGGAKRLEPKVMQVLVCLADRPGAVLPKEQRCGPSGRTLSSPRTC